jgi:hypothetical protein
MDILYIIVLLYLATKMRGTSDYKTNTLFTLQNLLHEYLHIKVKTQILRGILPVYHIPTYKTQ